MTPESKSVVVACLVLSGSFNAFGAEIKDYELLRFLYLDTGCGLSTIVERRHVQGALEVRVDCVNKTAFPDGAQVICDDGNDVRTCSLATNATRFHSLELLRKKAD